MQVKLDAFVTPQGGGEFSVSFSHRFTPQEKSLAFTAWEVAWPPLPVTVGLITVVKRKTVPVGNQRSVPVGALLFEVFVALAVGIHCGTSLVA